MMPTTTPMMRPMTANISTPSGWPRAGAGGAGAGSWFGSRISVGGNLGVAQGACGTTREDELVLGGDVHRDAEVVAQGAEVAAGRATRHPCLHLFRVTDRLDHVGRSEERRVGNECRLGGW